MSFNTFSRAGKRKFGLKAACAGCGAGHRSSKMNRSYHIPDVCYIKLLHTTPAIIPLDVSSSLSSSSSSSASFCSSSSSFSSSPSVSSSSSSPSSSSNFPFSRSSSSPSYEIENKSPSSLNQLPNIHKHNRLCNGCYFDHQKAKNLISSSGRESTNPSTTPTHCPLLIEGEDVYSIISTNHLQWLLHLNSLWKKIAFELQTSRVDDADSLPSNTSSTHAELNLKSMAKIFLYFLHYSPKETRLDPLHDSFMDIGSGYGWPTLLARIGFGVAKVYGIELVRERYQLSMSYLCQVMSSCRVDFLSGYRDNPILDNKFLLSEWASSVQTRHQAGKSKKRKTSNNIRKNSTRDDDHDDEYHDDDCNQQSSSHSNSLPRSSHSHPNNLSSNHLTTSTSSSSSSSSSIIPILLPAGVQLFEGDIKELWTTDAEFHSCFTHTSHFTLFDLRFSDHSMIFIAKTLNSCEKARVFSSMRTADEWKRWGLTLWECVGKMSHMVFKTASQSSSIYFFKRMITSESKKMKQTKQKLYQMPIELQRNVNRLTLV